MKIVIVRIEVLKKGNKRLCIRPLRANDRCIACKSYDVCESRRVNKPIHDKRAKILKKIEKAKKQLRKFEMEFEKL